MRAPSNKLHETWHSINIAFPCGLHITGRRQHTKCRRTTWHRDVTWRLTSHDSCELLTVYDVHVWQHQLVVSNMSTSHRFFATSSFGYQCLRGYSSKLLLTASEAPGLPTSAALPSHSLTVQAVLVSARLNVAICSFHEPKQLTMLGRRSVFITAWHRGAKLW